jgi:hypothetical protein
MVAARLLAGKHGRGVEDRVFRKLGDLVGDLDWTAILLERDRHIDVADFLRRRA